MNRDGLKESVWQQSVVNNNISTAFNPEKIYDVVIAGAGITGITTALLLQSAGKSVFIAEARNLGFGTTGGTTAHLNNFFDTSYDQVISKFDIDKAKLFASAGEEAISMIRQFVETYKIDCKYSEHTGYIFSVEEDQNKLLDNLVEGTRKVGLAIDYVNDSPFPIPYLKIVSIPGQAQFNPIEYIDALVGVFKKNGGDIAKDCRVTAAEEGEIITVTTSLGQVKAKNLVYATHIPPGVNILHFRNAPYRSYAIAVKLKDGQYPHEMGYDMYDPYHYYRSQVVNGGEYLIVGGEDHKTGHEENTAKSLRNLEAYVRKYFDVEEVAYSWSSQYFESADGLPYIGHLPGNRENVYTATGFNGNGMTLGTISGRILADLILTGKSKYKELFLPSRVKPVAGFANFIKENADVAARFVGDRFNAEKIKELTEVAAGEAKIIKQDGHTLALYKDEQLQLHVINAVCPHAKCLVAWNNSELSWDCPCHGSRFSVDGDLLTAPAVNDLKKITLE